MCPSSITFLLHLRLQMCFLIKLPGGFSFITVAVSEWGVSRYQVTEQAGNQILNSSGTRKENYIQMGEYVMLTILMATEWVMVQTTALFHIKKQWAITLQALLDTDTTCIFWYMWESYKWTIFCMEAMMDKCITVNVQDLNNCKEGRTFERLCKFKGYAICLQEIHLLNILNRGGRPNACSMSTD